MQQFGRKYRIEIGNNKESISFNNLRIEFSIEKTITLDPNQAEISIYNLNQSHRALISTKKYNYVRLFVSYNSDDLRLLFSGDVVKVENKRKQLDFITTLHCADGFEAFSDKFISKTITSASDSDVVTHASENMNLKFYKFDLPQDRVLPRGKVMFYDTKKSLEIVAKNNDAQCSVQDNQILILPKSKALKGEDGFILSESTGMIDSPQKTDTGVNVVSLCNPHFKVGSLVRIKSIIKELSGDYKIVKIVHSGDILSNKWNSSLTCEGGNYEIIK